MNTHTYITDKLAFLLEIHSFIMLQRKRKGTAITPKAKSANECVGFGAKLKFSADEENDKSISNYRENVKKPAENPKPQLH